MDENTLVISYGSRYGLWIFTLHTDSNTCKGEMIDRGFAATDITCSQDGKVYVTHVYRAIAKTEVRIYTIHNRTKEVWEPNGIKAVRSRDVNIAVNNDFIVMDSGNVVYVFNKDQVMLYNITLNLEGFLGETYLTDTDKMWGVFYAKHHDGRSEWLEQVIAIDLHTQEYNMTRRYVDRRWGEPYGVSGIKPDIVSLSWEGKEVRMYSDTGDFKKRIPIDPPVNGGYIPRHATFKTREGNVLIAFDAAFAKVPIYSFNL